MLLAQYRESGRAITVRPLAASARSTSESTAKLHYSAFAELVARELGYKPPTDAPKPKWWMAIATSPSDENATDATEFTMRPELAEAIELMGWVRAQLTHCVARLRPSRAPPAQRWASAVPRWPIRIRISLTSIPAFRIIRRGKTSVLVAVRLWRSACESLLNSNSPSHLSWEPPCRVAPHVEPF